MKFATSRKRFSLQVKILVPVITLLVLLAAAALWLVNLRISDQFSQNGAERLATAANVFQKVQESRDAELLAKYRNALNEPRVKTAAKSSRFSTLKSTLDDLMQELVADKGATVVSFTSIKDGHEEAVSGVNSDSQFTLAEFQSHATESVRRATEEQPGWSTVPVGNQLLNIISLPIAASDDTTAVLTFGVKLDESAALEIRQLTGGDIAFLSDGKVVASSLPKSQFASLTARFKDLRSQPASGEIRTGPRVILTDEYYLCQAGQLPASAADDKTGCLLLVSARQAFADFRQMQQMLLILGVLSLLLVTAVIWISVRQITRPLEQLRENAEAVGRGDFSRQVEINSQDECGELAAAFNQMTENVKTSREDLEKTARTLRTAQNQTIQSEKLAGIAEFVSGVAHELNNPLTSVMGFSELLQQSDMPEQQRRYLDVIFKSAKRCQKIVQSLLSFARRHAPERKVVCVNEIIESAVEILQYQMRASNIEVVTQLDPRLPATEVDTHQMQQVFLNLINNARQAIEAHQTKGWLHISTEAADGRVRIIFRDNGPGITPENIRKIFNPFFTTKEVGKGTGLGLSLCYGIISEHGGTITPHSKPGEGAAFIIELPLAQAAPKPAEKSAAPQPQNVPDGAGKRVLVIDDEDSILQMIREALTRNGYKVDIAHDGESALRRLGQYHYDLALCDWKMPGLNGQDVYERLNATNPEMSRRLIFITGDIVNQNTQEFLRAKDKVCLSKPFTLGEFRSAIDRVITP